MVVVSIHSCKEKDNNPDVSDIKVSLQTKRLDKDLYGIDTNNVAAGLQQLQSVYPDFLNFYLDTLLGFGVNGNYTEENEAIALGVKKFLTDKDCRGVMDTVIKRFPDTKDVEEELVKGFKYYKHYYPNYKEPRIIYMTSCLNNWGAFTYGSDIVGIGLDMFLAPGYPFYQSVGVPDYMEKQLTKENIPVAVFRAIYQDEHPFIPQNSTLLDMMLQRGKERYFLSKVIPFVPEHVRLGFTEQQLEWCEKNEAMVYNFFMSEDLLYSTDWQKILRYVNEGPTSAGMPAESPGNIGTWVGLRIVESYLKKNDKTTMQDLLNDKQEPQIFLQRSGYKPR
jgi:hypothetical protein